MSTKKKLIRPTEINNFYVDEITNDSDAYRIIHAVRRRDLFPFVVEQIERGKFILISGFKEFSAYLKTHPHTYIPVQVQPRTNEMERLIKILEITIPLKDTSWIFKNEHVMRLIDDFNLNENEIAIATNQTPSKIRSYILDRRIPFHIRQVAIERRAKTVVTNICQSTVASENMKRFLYDRAILPENDERRCTSKKLTQFMEFCRANHNDILQIGESDLEELIEWLFINDFFMSPHFRLLLTTFLDENRSQSSG